jgi:DNA-binding transcriptional LysR family regulator
MIPGIDMVNLRTFDLNLLRALDALLTEPQVSAAARRLNLSQPATSAALARLRTALSDQLLTRSGNQMLLTPLAVSLRPQVRRILSDIEQTLRDASSFDAALSERCFRVAANDYATVVALAPLVERIRLHAPRIVVEVVPLDDRFEERLAEDDYDLAIRDRWSLQGSQRLETLFTEEYVCVARADHPRLSACPTLDEFVAEDHALISPRGRVPGVFDSALGKRGRSRHVAVTLPHFLAAPAIITHTDLVITLPSRVAARFAKLYALRVFRPPLPVAGFKVAMAWHRRSDADAAVGWLKDQLRVVAKDIAPARTAPTT